MSQETTTFGIDLGTTYSCISYLKDGHPTVCLNLEGDRTTPSVVRMMIEDTVPVVGKTAKDTSVIYPDDTIQFVKSKIGKVESFEIGQPDARRTVTPEQVSSEILKKLASDAEKYTNMPVKDVVITVPAYFGYNEREATKRAGIEAGLNVISIVEEPTAAAFYYLCEQDDTDATVCVYDLGGGTFDVTAIKKEGTAITCLTTDGDHDLGGKNWDQELIEHVLLRFREETGLEDEAVMTGSIYFKDRVYITDNGVTRELMTSESDVYAILKLGNYQLSSNDKVSYEEVSSNTAYITIYRAFDVNVTADGETKAVPMIEGTVADVLEKAGITLGEYDELSCELTDRAYKDMDITVTRVEYVTRESTSDIAYDTEYTDNCNLAIGTENVVTAGVNGKCVYTVKEKYVDGKLTSQELISEKTTAEPVTQVVERGTASAVPYSKTSDPEAVKLVNGIPENYTRVLSGKSTAYTAGYGARTASGRAAEIGTCAVNPNVIPYGSKLYIVSHDGRKVYGYAVAADTGLGLMDGTVLVDLYFGSMADHYYDSCAWGAVQVDIYVLEEGNG